MPIADFYFVIRSPLCPVSSFIIGKILYNDISKDVWRYVFTNVCVASVAYLLKTSLSTCTIKLKVMLRFLLRVNYVKSIGKVNLCTSSICDTNAICLTPSA